MIKYEYMGQVANGPVTEDALNVLGQEGWLLTALTPVEAGLLYIFAREEQVVLTPATYKH